MKPSSNKDRSVLPPLKVFPVASEDQTNAPGVAIGCQSSPLARRKPQSRLKNNILPSKPWNTRDMLANLPNITGDRTEDFDLHREARAYQVGSNSRPNSRPQSPAMGVRETLELGSPRRPLCRRSRSSSLDSFSEELLGLSGGNSENENEHFSGRPCVYTPQDGRVPPRPPSIDASDLINCLNSEVYFYNEEETSDFDSRTGSLENSPPGRIMPPSPASNKTYKFGKAPPNDRVLLALRSYESHEAGFPQMSEEDATEKRYPLTHSENSNFSRLHTNESDSIEY